MIKLAYNLTRLLDSHALIWFAGPLLGQHLGGVIMSNRRNYDSDLSYLMNSQGRGRASGGRKKRGKKRYGYWLSNKFVLGFAALSLCLLVAYFSFYKLKENLGEYFLRFSAKAGFVIKDVQVTGREYTTVPQILKLLRVGGNEPILTFDPHAAQTALKKLPWISEAIVERRLPDVVFVKLTERIPIALWQNNRKLYLIDEAGAVIADKGLEEFPNLPMLVGGEAPSLAKALFDELVKVPRLWKRVDAAILVSNRRWDLRLDNNVLVRLPEKHISKALEKLAVSDADYKLLDRDIAVIDLRVEGRLTIRPTNRNNKQATEVGEVM